MDAHTSANNLPPPAPAKAAPIAPDSEAESNHHALLDPLQRATGIGAAFSADTTQGSGGGDVNVDPVNNGVSGGHSEFSMHSKVVAPPPPHLTPLDQLLATQNPGIATPPPMSASGGAPSSSDLTTDSARQAVENAYASVPFNPDLNPSAAVIAQPQETEMHQPPPEQNGTPSLNLPNSPIPPTAPPPMPPPIVPQDPNGPMNTPYGPMPPPSL
jgi:hypothetical protein